MATKRISPTNLWNFAGMYLCTLYSHEVFDNNIVRELLELEGWCTGSYCSFNIRPPYVSNHVLGS